MDVYRRLQDYRAQTGGEPGLLMLENHGVFVTGSTADEVRATYHRVMKTLRARYDAAGISLELKSGLPGPDETLQGIKTQLAGWLGSAGAAVVHSAPFTVAEGPVSPDHIVYSKSYAYSGALSKEGLEAFRAKHGYWPRVIATPVAVFGVGASVKQAQLALELAQDGALIVQLAGAFGGRRYLAEVSREFIENWEVESYRSQQIA
jgi:rhamnose utilization protein RhaD (predicted bifunctional aldolase and dehydrogenase)